MTRVLSALVLLPVVIGTIWFAPPEGTLFLAVIAGVLAVHEYCGIARALDIFVPRGIAATAVVLICCAMWLDEQPADYELRAVYEAPARLVALVVLALLTVVGAWSVARGQRRGALADAAATVLAPVYIGLPLGALVAVRASVSLDGRWAVLLMLATIVVSDSAQYYTGRAFGKRRLAPEISPKKTVEGAVGGVVFGMLAFVMGGRYLFASPLWLLVLSGAAMVLLGIVGDLFESLLKRSAGLKDSSQLIPGHGGVLDRIDSWLFVAPFYYLYLKFLV